ncbi:MarR family transcriptional regulator, partial [Kitasatospora sp. NPDC059571]|uniref:MarR family transcriptional regulator n=1 Tax=Kitasatospora sp. NPDC059571 TaxID=3346871 RepID=UPI003680E670
GMLRVLGDPGGVFHLTCGRITAVDSPGAPDAATLLLRTGRVGEAEWAAACRVGAAGGSTGEDLVTRALVGAAELQLICTMAAMDGAFAVAVGRVDGCTLTDAAAAPRLAPPAGIDPEWLLHETERRLRALDSLRTPLSPFHDRLAASPLASDARRELLRYVNGRRTARDIAFLLGRGVYAVTVEASRLLTEGLLVVAPREQLPKRRTARPDDDGTALDRNVLPLRPVTGHRLPTD